MLRNNFSLTKYLNKEINKFSTEVFVQFVVEFFHKKHEKYKLHIKGCHKSTTSNIRLITISSRYINSILSIPGYTLEDLFMIFDGNSHGKLSQAIDYSFLIRTMPKTNMLDFKRLCSSLGINSALTLLTQNDFGLLMAAAKHDKKHIVIIIVTHYMTRLTDKNQLKQFLSVFMQIQQMRDAVEYDAYITSLVEEFIQESSYYRKSAASQPFTDIEDAKHSDKDSDYKKPTPR